LDLSEKLLINDTYFTGIRDGIGGVETRLRAENPRRHCWIPNSSNDYILSPTSTPAPDTTQPSTLSVQWALILGVKRREC